MIKESEQNLPKVKVLRATLDVFFVLSPGVLRYPEVASFNGLEPTLAVFTWGHVLEIGCVQNGDANLGDDVRIFLPGFNIDTHKPHRRRLGSGFSCLVLAETKVALCALQSVTPSKVGFKALVRVLLGLFSLLVGVGNHLQDRDELRLPLLGSLLDIVLGLRAGNKTTEVLEFIGTVGAAKKTRSRRVAIAKNQSELGFVLAGGDGKVDFQPSIDRVQHMLELVGGHKQPRLRMDRFGLVKVITIVKSVSPRRFAIPQDQNLHIPDPVLVKSFNGKHFLGLHSLVSQTRSSDDENRN